MSSKRMPRQPVPALKVPVIEHGDWYMAAQKPSHFTLILVYRGLHCPICRGYLKELQTLQDEFEKHGVNVLALSTDTEERARTTHIQWGLACRSATVCRSKLPVPGVYIFPPAVA